jgi:hypothetical protein
VFGKRLTLSSLPEVLILEARSRIFGSLLGMRPNGSRDEGCNNKSCNSAWGLAM